MSNFITNSHEKDLKTRINSLISVSEELNFLVGFFYFSGLRDLYESLKENNKVILKILVGLKVDVINGQIIESGYSEKLTDDEKFHLFVKSLTNFINTDYFDSKEFYEQSLYFINLLKNGKLTIRKTLEPNHSKLYIFKLVESQVKNKLFITGSSNLTRAGLIAQNEFNVEISDYGVDEAEKYFDTLWENAVKITEVDKNRVILLNKLEQETLIREITPFEAYLFVIKSYLESYKHTDIGTSVVELMAKKGYKQYKYQLDAIKQALSIIEENNGVIIADVVGLGKSIIASAVAKHLRARGIVICPPGLMGDDNKNEGWTKYLEEFGLFDWEVRSSGDLENTLEFVKKRDDIEVVIVDEAHRFRNKETKSYELLKNICRNRKVILLTATPFNNKPNDVLALLSLFIPPKKSMITLDNNLEEVFGELDGMFKFLGYIKKNHNSKDPEKREKAKRYYEDIFGKANIDLSKVKSKTKEIAETIRNIIEPVMIRRNRIDLQKNPEYKNEITDLSVIEDPIEEFFKLTREQLEFYDKVINKFFANPEDGGEFKGAIYRPYEYEIGFTGFSDIEDGKMKKEEQFELIQQRSLYDLMRRLIVKRFESSFGAFKKTIERFKSIYETCYKFIDKTGEYILHRDLLEKIVELDPEEIEQELIEYEKRIKENHLSKKYKRYKINNFVEKDRFLEDISQDIVLFKKILKQLDELNLVNNDPKANKLYEVLKTELNKKPKKNEPKRKIIVFSEYSDTIEYLKKKLENEYTDFFKRVLVVYGNLSESKILEIIENFDASYKKQKDDYDVILATDKLSEGFNLNRAGMVINYDIPWNPVRVIQRLGRINRISKKVFDSLYIMNFFPTEKGAEYVKSREIAQNKMYMIHNTLGEDAKIFDVDEEPTASELYNRINKNPDKIDEESFYTKMLNLYNGYKEKYPDLINSLDNMPKRVKVIKPSNSNEFFVFFKKHRLFAKRALDLENIEEVPISEAIESIACNSDTESLKIDDKFWELYEKVKSDYKKINITKAKGESSEKSAYNVIKYLQMNLPEMTGLRNFLRVLEEDIIEYGTLPDYTLKRITDLAKQSIDIKKAIKLFEELKNELGEDYLEKIKSRIYKDKEIIIAIENRAVQENGG